MSMFIYLLGPMMIKKHQGLNKPNLDYPYLSLPDIDEGEIDPIWEKCREEHLKQEINNGL